MSRNPEKTVYIGNLDVKVSERVLYDILIQVGHLIDLYMPRDKESDRHKGYAFAEYETVEIADYAVKLFSGHVRLYDKTVKFGMSGQDKISQNSSTPVAPQPAFSPLPNNCPSLLSMPPHDRQASQLHTLGLVDCMASSGAYSASPPVYRQAFDSTPFSSLLNNCLSPLSALSYDRQAPQVHAHDLVNFRDPFGAAYSIPPPVYHQAPSFGLLNSGFNSGDYEYNRHVFEAMLNNVSCPTRSHPITYPSY